MECVKVPDPISIDGVKFNITPHQKDLTQKLAEEMFLDPTEAFKIVSQQSRIGVTDLERLEKAYMKERTAVLRVVKALHMLAQEKSLVSNLAHEVLSKIREDTMFLVNLVEGIKLRVEGHLPPKAMSDPNYSLLWSNQVCHPVCVLMADPGGRIRDSGHFIRGDTI
jgi:hypothetical protein